METLTFNLTPEDFGLELESSFNDVETIKPQPVKDNKLFAGFSSDTGVFEVNTSFTFTSKHAELYLFQLFASKYLTEEVLSNSGSDLTGLIENLGRSLHEFDRYSVIDAISSIWHLEHNSLRSSGWGFCYLGEETFDLSMEETPSERYLQVARFFGFMEAIATDESLVALRAINTNAKSGRGHSSPRTGMFVHEYNIVRFARGKYCSPYKLEKMVWATKEKARTKHGVNISFEQALEALRVTKSTSKAATVAAYSKLGLHRDFGECKSYRHARDGMISYYQAKAKAQANNKKIFLLKGEDKVAAYAYRVDGSYTITLNEGHGMVDYFSNDPRREDLRILPLFSERVGFYYDGDNYIPFLKLKIEDFSKMEWDELHGEFSRVASKGKKLGIEYKTIQTPFGLKTTLVTDLGEIQGSSFKCAYRTYQRRLYADKLDSINVEELAPKANVLLHLEDSYDAGNCHAGTEAMAKRLGISDRKVIGVPVLWQLAKEKEEASCHLLQNAIKMAILKAMEEVSPSK